MWPLIMLGAQFLSKEMQKGQDKHDEVAKLLAQNASRLGGNTAPLEAAQFNQQENHKMFADPSTLLKLYGASGGAASPAAAAPGPITGGGGDGGMMSSLGGGLMTPSDWGGGGQLMTPTDWMSPEDKLKGMSIL
jgi:hypothetical protein